MTSIQTVTLEVADPAAADAFYGAAFDLGGRLDLRASEAPTSGFRAFTLSLVVSQPATVDELIGAALDAGAAPLKPAKKSLWGYGGVVQAPDGSIWKVATSSKKDIGPATREIDDMVLLLGVSNVAESKQFYADRGLQVAKSFARVYVEFATTGVKLALYKRRALAKDAGVPADGTGSRRIAIRSDAGPFTDPDGFGWEAAESETSELRQARPRRQAEPRGDADIRSNTNEEVSMSPKKDSQKAAKGSTATNMRSRRFTDEERAAMRERAQELKAAGEGGRGKRRAREDRRDAGTGSRHGRADPCHHQSQRASPLAENLVRDARIRQGRQRRLLLPERAEVQGEVRDARLQRQGEPRRRRHVADRLRADGTDRRR